MKPVLAFSSKVPLTRRRQQEKEWKRLLSRKPRDSRIPSVQPLRESNEPDPVYMHHLMLASSLLLSCTAEVMRVPVLAVLLHDQVRLLDSSGVGGGEEFAHQQALAWFIEHF